MGPVAGGARRRLACRPSGQEVVQGGTLVVLVGPEGRGKDMLIAIARRRFATSSLHVFPRRLITRSLGPEGTDVVVSRRTLHALACEGRLLAGWRIGDVACALARESLAGLKTGQVATIAATATVASALAKHWSDVRLVEVRSGPDIVRGPSQAKTLAPTAGRGSDQSALVIAHDSDLATAASRLLDYLAMLGQQQQPNRATARPAATTASASPV